MKLNQIIKVELDAWAGTDNRRARVGGRLNIKPTENSIHVNLFLDNGEDHYFHFQPEDIRKLIGPLAQASEITADAQLDREGRYAVIKQEFRDGRPVTFMEAANGAILQTLDDATAEVKAAMKDTEIKRYFDLHARVMSEITDVYIALSGLRAGDSVDPLEVTYIKTLDRLLTRQLRIEEDLVKLIGVKPKRDADV